MFLFHYNKEKVWKITIKCHLDPVLENMTFLGKSTRFWGVGKRGRKVKFNLSPGRPVRLMMVLVWGEGGGMGTWIDLILNYVQFKKGVS